MTSSSSKGVVISIAANPEEDLPPAPPDFLLPLADPPLRSDNDAEPLRTVGSSSSLSMMALTGIICRHEKNGRGLVEALIRGELGQ